jgi:hypothetical protein
MLAPIACAAAAYVAEDADARRTTVEQVAALNWDAPGAPGAGACNATVVMMDDRRWAPRGAAGADARDGPAGRGDGGKDVPYYAKTLALNYLYARRHRMGFALVRPTRGAWLADGASGLCPAWCRVKALASLVASWRAEPGRCHWLLYIDSDAYVREQHTNFVRRLGAPANADAHVALAREEPPAGAFRSPRRRAHGVRVPSLNAGVLFVKVRRQRTTGGRARARVDRA